MDIVCSPKGIINTERPGRGAAAMARAGFENVALDFGAWWDGRAMKNAGQDYTNQTDGIKRWMVGEQGRAAQGGAVRGALVGHACAEFEKNGMRVAIAIAPGIEGRDKRACSSEFLLWLVEECIRTCGKAGCPYLVIPAFSTRGADGEGMDGSAFSARGTGGENDGEFAFSERGADGGDLEIRASCYQRLAYVARENGVTLLLKNECRDLNGHLVRGAFCDAKEAAEFLDLLNAEAKNQARIQEQDARTGGSRGIKACVPIFGFCLDAGVCNICGQNMYDFVHELGNRLKAVVLCDNDGRAECSLLPFANVGAFGLRTDWRGLICGLREIDFDGPAVLRFSDSFCATPGILRAKYLDFAKSMGDYFQWQVGQRRVLAKYRNRVLFGAGNMCRNYMQYYGGVFPPLFTCDNDKRLWGTRLEGLMVKDPEELRGLPKDCAIFICNIYYEEIAEQLRGMGLENPVEYFNDEYLPFGRDWKWRK